ncbi:HAD family phosphatase [Petrotoga sp. 9PWA.NaAc.5.4]|uniref:HAD family hydrolase n=1 Tax=Petrotoga sp. 9PWA.NaAc.5.4 TaxID=1434328 RepID=UPI000CB57B68|nr:HAD family phosphatase [Petrotoga sp. 9PWA.NaAc.5.4]PNR95327.1 phosphatase [Petrotoga sp. 9PWA.NaAc.5.4]
MIKAIIFDMDGVIIDSEPIHYDANKRIFDELGIPITQSIYVKYIGVSNEDMWNEIKNEYDLKQTVQELVDRQNLENLEHIKKYAKEPISGVVELLELLKNNSYKVALASSSPEILIKEVLEKFQLSKYFDVVVSAESVSRGKPKPDLFIYTAGLLNVKPRECLVIEDSKNGVKAAKCAGMVCIGFNNPNSMNQDLSKADIIVENMNEITLELIEKFNKD